MKPGQELSEVLGDKVEYIVGKNGPFLDACLNLIDGNGPSPANKAPRKPPSGPRR